MRRREHALRPRIRGLGLAVGSGLLLIAGCVRVDAAPNGIASTQLRAAPPSIVIGDSLRDSTGAAVPVDGVAYDPEGNPIPTAQFRYAYVPLVPDTSAGARTDTALVVDSVTGAVRATSTWVKSSGRIVARIGTSIQLADTIAIVPRPDSLVATAAQDTLRYDCTDPGTFLSAQDTTSGSFNAVGPFTLTVRGDSAGRRVGIRRWLVRWSVDSVPAPIPIVPRYPNGTGATAGAADTGSVPALAIVPSGVDRLITYDTTVASGTSVGTSSVRLRIRPFALGPRYSADSLFRVTLRASVIAGPGVPVRGSPAVGVFAVVLSRTSTPLLSDFPGYPCKSP